MSLKLAILGASTGQLGLCKKAREMKLQTICFAWDKGAVCRDYVDIFYNISVCDVDAIVDICRSEGISGIVSNASDFLCDKVAYIANKLGLPGNNFEDICRIKDKSYVRSIAQTVTGLSSIWYYKGDSNFPASYPCIIKPTSGSSKKGVSLVKDKKGYDKALAYAKEADAGDVLVEQYIEGREISVETISNKSTHYVVQITDKDTSGPPHFVEIAHHQPAIVDSIIKERICSIVSELLTKVGYVNGAAHVELKIDSHNNIYLVELNARGGGDFISDTLVELSTGYDYLKGMIESALGDFKEPMIQQNNYAGVYYLCQQSSMTLPFIEYAKSQPWHWSSQVDSCDVTEAKSNYDRNGYLIYCGDEKVVPPLVSIRCLAFNHEPFIRQCLDGFVMQKTSFRFEAVIHDDASNDGTADIIREYARKYPEIIKPIFETENQYSKHDGSLGKIINSAMLGKYIAMCEGDDFWTDPQKLQKQVDFLERNPEYGVTYSAYRTVDYRGKDFDYPPSKVYLSRSKSGDIFLDLLKGNFPQTLTVLYRRDMFDPSLIPPYQYDYTFFLNFSLRTKFYFFSEEFGCYRINPSGAIQTNALADVDTVRIQLFFLKEYFQHKEYRRSKSVDLQIVSFMTECCCGFHYYVKYRDLFWAIIKSRPSLVFILPRGLVEARRRHKRSLHKH